jgi:multiple sugar transport system ATP-binding protein
MAVMETGVVRQVGTPLDVFRRPANLFVARFTGSTPMNLLQATVDAGRLNIAGHALRLPKDFARVLQEGRPVTVGIRPEYASFSSSSEPVSLPGTVMVIEQLGVSSLVTLEDRDLSLRVIVPADDAPEPGEKGWLVPDLRHVLLYGPDGELMADPRPAVSPAADHV